MVKTFWVLMQIHGSGFQHELEISVDSNYPSRPCRSPADVHLRTFLLVQLDGMTHYINSRFNHQYR